MQPLDIDDLLPLEEYAARRREFFDSHRRYVDRYRRVRVGPSVTFIFENRQTLWFRVHEIIRIARLVEPSRVREELRLYNAMLPGRGRLHTALMVEPEAEGALNDLESGHITLAVSGQSQTATLVTCRPEDRCSGMAHWVQFDLTSAGRTAFADLEVPAFLTIDHADYRHHSPLSDDVRQSLLDDLTLSDRDAA